MPMQVELKMFCNHPMPPAGGNATEGTTHLGSQLAALQSLICFLEDSGMSFQLVLKPEDSIFGSLEVRQDFGGRVAEDPTFFHPPISLQQLANKLSPQPQVEN